MRIQADRNVCIGSGNCVLVAGDIFDQDEEALVRLIAEVPPADREDSVREAITRCPSGALSIAEG